MQSFLLCFRDILDYLVRRTGERRFALPQPPLPFDGVREVTTFGNACPQQEVKLPIKFPIRFPVASVNRSEDCKLAIPMQACVLISSIHRPFHQRCTSSQHSKRKGAPCSCGKFYAMHLLKELTAFLTVYPWRSALSLSCGVSTDSGPPGGFQIGDTSMYPGDTVVNRSIALNEPVIFVSANYRVNGKNSFF
jgi:acetylcholinesterase